MQASIYLDYVSIKVSHVTITIWTNILAPFFKNKADKFKETLDLNSDDWHSCIY